jgi:hypothetical protein
MFVLWVRLLLDRRYRSWVTGWIRCSGFSSIHFALSANSLNVSFQFSVLTYFIRRSGSVAARRGRAAAGGCYCVALLATLAFLTAPQRHAAAHHERAGLGFAKS